jgi:hypothetical protein
MTKIINFVGPVHMSRQHKGLRQEAEAANIDLDSLPKGSFVIFVASHQRRYKAYGPNSAFIDHDLSPLTLQETLQQNAYQLDVGLENNIMVKLPENAKKALGKFFENFEKDKKSKKRR